MSPRSTTSTTRFSAQRGRWLRPVWVGLALLVWGLVVADFPRMWGTGGDASPELMAYFVRRGLPGNFHGLYKIVADLVFLSAFSWVAGLLLWKRGNDWQALLTGVMVMCTGFIYANGLYAVGLAAYPAALLTALGDTLQVVFLFTFPSGQYVPRWARWGVGPLLLFRFIIWLTLYQHGGNQAAWDVGVMVALLLLGLGTQFYRYRRFSTPSERQQGKWLLFGFGFAIPIAAAYIFAVNVFNIFGPLGPSNYFLIIALRTVQQGALFVFPLTVVLSIITYRLWDIDLTINRSLFIVAVTGMLVVPFVAAFIIIEYGLSRLLGAGNSLISVGVAALTAGLLFNPARQQARDFIDRRVYGLRFNLNELQKGQGLAPLTNPGLLSGQTLGDYGLRGVAGRGGMGEVYEGVHTPTGQRVALKILADKYVHEPAFRQRFTREAQLTMTLTHPHIVKVLDYGESDRLIYMVMEFVAGPDLGQRLKTQGRLSLAEVRSFAVPLAAALDYAHAQGFVHRDIKPSNVMLRRVNGGSEPVLMDFGVARAPDTHGELTGSGAVGTIDYMAPEQIRAAEKVDHRADLYALGLLFYEALTGERPFKGNPAQVMFAHLQQPPPDPRALVPDLPAATAAALMRALEKEPGRRHETAAELVEALFPA